MAVVDPLSLALPVKLPVLGCLDRVGLVPLPLERQRVLVELNPFLCNLAVVNVPVGLCCGLGLWAGLILLTYPHVLLAASPYLYLGSCRHAPAFVPLCPRTCSNNTYPARNRNRYTQKMM